MKTGILICDHIPAPFQHHAIHYPEMFEAWLPDLDFEEYFVVDNEFPERAMVCDAWMVNGSRASVYDDKPWISRLKAFVREIHQSGRPFLGVCFGHQILAEALGGKVLPAESRWCVGVHEFSLTQQRAWMQPHQDPFNLLMMCQDQVQQLPAGATLLASSPACPVGMFEVEGRMLGIQAHPEFTKAYDRALMEARVERMGTETVQTGIESLNLPVHADIFRQWAVQFLTRAQSH